MQNAFNKYSQRPSLMSLVYGIWESAVENFILEISIVEIKIKMQTYFKISFKSLVSNNAIIKQLKRITGGHNKLL